MLLWSGVRPTTLSPTKFLGGYAWHGRIGVSCDGLLGHDASRTHCLTLCDLQQPRRGVYSGGGDTGYGCAYGGSDVLERAHTELE